MWKEAHDLILTPKPGAGEPGGLSKFYANVTPGQDYHAKPVRLGQALWNYEFHDDDGKRILLSNNYRRRYFRQRRVS